MYLSPVHLAVAPTAESTPCRRGDRAADRATQQETLGGPLRSADPPTAEGRSAEGKTVSGHRESESRVPLRGERMQVSMYYYGCCCCYYLKYYYYYSYRHYHYYSEGQADKDRSVRTRRKAATGRAKRACH